jgi:putative addiction module killer protein
VYEILHYTDRSGQDKYQVWLDSLRDRQAKMRIVQRVNRLEAGNFGDCKPCRDGVWELRIDYGPGYRVYYALVDKTVVLLLAGGDKRRQEDDITRSAQCLDDYRRQTR